MKNLTAFEKERNNLMEQLYSLLDQEVRATSGFEQTLLHLSDLLEPHLAKTQQITPDEVHFFFKDDLDLIQLYRADGDTCLLCVSPPAGPYPLDRQISWARQLIIALQSSKNGERTFDLHKG